MRLGTPLALIVFAPVAFALGIHPALASSYPVSGGESNPSFSGSGVLTASSNGNGTYTITGVSGDGVTGLLDTNTFLGNDNQLLPGSSTVLDSAGFAFTDTWDGNDYTVNIHSTGDGAYAASVGTDPDDTVAITFDLGTPRSAALATIHQLATAAPSETFRYTFTAAVAQTPEPAGVALLGTGFLGLAGLVKRRKR